MSLTPEQITSLGSELHRALSEVRAIDPLILRHPGLTIDDAYGVQQAMVGHRLQAGQTVVGKKIGVTSKVVMEMLKVDQPDFGQLLSGMAHGDGASIKAADFIAPRAEGEIAFTMARDVMGPGLTNADVLPCIAHVSPCFEIVDSRIRDWKISIFDTVSDNGSSGAYVLGAAKAKPSSLDLRTIGMVLEKNGEVIGTGAGAAALGHPRHLARQPARQPRHPAQGRRGDPLRLAVHHVPGPGRRPHHDDAVGPRLLQRALHRLIHR